MKPDAFIGEAEHPVDDTTVAMQMGVQRRAEVMDKAYGP